MDHPTVWRTHPVYTLYQASDDGRVRSIGRYVRRRGNGIWWHPGRELKTFRRRGGYLGGNISVDGRRINFEVHRFVCETFHGLAPSEDVETRHLNGDQLDNRSSNLTWGTKSQNACDRVRHGTHWEAKRLRCAAGHEYTPENTYRAPSAPNKRICRKCTRLREMRRVRIRKR